MESVTIEEIKKFLTLNTGSGYGDGSSDCSSSGYDSGNGPGYGCASGYGKHNGHGRGSGFDLNNGFSDGYDYGHGSGDGYGCYDGTGFCNSYSYSYDIDCDDVYSPSTGYNNGCTVYNIKLFNDFPVFDIDAFPTIFYSVKGSYARGAILRDDLTLSDCYIARVDDSFAHGDTLADAVRDATEKAQQALPVEERIARFKVQFPSLQDKAKCSVFYSWHHILTGSCEFGRNEFVKAHGLDMEKEYTVDYFLSITQESYGGEVIKKLRDSYEK